MPTEEPPVGLGAKDRFDAAMKLADFIAQRVTDRRQYEWKITLGLWAVLAAAPLYVRTKPPAVVLALGLAVLVLAFSFLFIRPIAIEHGTDSEDMFAHYHAAEDIAGLAPQHRKIKRIGPWWGLFQVATTVVLAVGAYYLIEVAPIVGKPAGS
jgi:hypothetical protein